MHLRQLRGYRVLCALLIVLLIMPGIVGCTGGLGKPDYSVESYDVSVQLQPDGSAIMTEKLMFNFNEDLREMDLFVNRLRNARLGDLAIIISEKNPDPDQLQLPAEESNILMQEMQPGDPEASAQSPMTWLQKEQEESIRLRLSLVISQGSSYQITVKYVLEEQIKRNEEIAYVHQQINILPDNIPLKNINVKYYLPYQPAGEDSWLRLVGDIDPKSSSVEVDHWITNWDKMNSQDFPETIMIMPAEYFQQIGVSANLPSRETLITEAQERLSKADNKMFWRESVEALIYFLLVLALIFILLIYFFFDREGIASFKSRYYLPESIELPPAVMSMVMRTGRPAGLIMSTLLDLVKRKELSLEGQLFTWLNANRNDYTGFKAYEIFLLQWLFEKASGGANTLSAVQLRDYAKVRSSSEEFRGYYDQFVELLSEEMIGYGLYDEAKSYYGRLIGQALAAAYVILSIVASVYLMSPVGMLLLLPAIVFFLYALSLRHLTSYGNEQYARGLAFRRYLSQFYELDRSETDIKLPDCDDAVKLLPYAVALNRTKLFMRQLITMAKENTADCGSGLLETYQNRTLATADKSNKKGESSGSGEELSAAAKAAAVEQIRLLGRDLVSMESVLAAGFYMSSSFHLMDDH